MFYKIKLKDHIRVPPDLFNEDAESAVIKRIKKKYEGHISKELGIVIDVSQIDEIGEGIIIPGDGASYYDTKFELLAFKPDMQEIVYGFVRDIADFGAFMTIGPLDGMIHISQTMDDYVSFSKDKVLMGTETKRTLKVNDLCRSRIIAVSFKELNNPKVGLTMRQPFLGKLEWADEEPIKRVKEEKPEKKKVKERQK